MIEYSFINIIINIIPRYVQKTWLLISALFVQNDVVVFCLVIVTS